MIGKRLFNDRYRIQTQLGEGGFGTVYLAEETKLDRKIALKVLFPHLTRNQEVAARFHREAKVMAQLQHEALPTVYTVDAEGELLAIAMEYVEGETLASHLKRRGPLSPQETGSLLEPIFRALEFVHERGVLHRDLKPENIMIQRRDGRAKLLDFGIARVFDGLDLTRTGLFIGSPPYVPPEQWRGLKHVDVRSEVYAMGIVSYECLTGRHPFVVDADTGPFGWAQAHHEQKPPPLTGVLSNIPLHQALNEVVLRALAKEPDVRYQSMAAFHNALRAALQIQNQAPTVRVPSLGVLDEVQLAENNENRCACVLLLDTSGSMSGKPIAALNEGLRRFHEDLCHNDLAKLRIDLALVTFDTDVRTVHDFSTADGLHLPLLRATGAATHMGTAILRAIEMIEERKRYYRQRALAYYRPWLLLLTDGRPVGEAPAVLERASARLREAEQQHQLAFYAIGVEPSADMALLGNLAGRRAFGLKGLEFTKLFLWLSRSLQDVARSQVTEQLELPAQVQF